LLNPPLLKFYILSVTDTFFEGKVTSNDNAFHLPLAELALRRHRDCMRYHAQRQ
jgi:hypothetical protein